MKKKKVLIGYDDFVALLENGGYFVDKSLLIKELVDTPNQVTLITRPRRFGKSLNFSMLKYFRENPECRMTQPLLHRDVCHLFSNLAISRAGEEYMKEQEQYPVVFLSFREAKMNDREDTEQKLKMAIAEEYDRHNYLLKSKAITEIPNPSNTRVSPYRPATRDIMRGQRGKPRWWHLRRQKPRGYLWRRGHQ
jgi:hypothetical protein